jgi:hypothetical protein
MGLLVVLNQLQIPFYLYYPRVTHTVLLSDAYDLYFFLVSSFCVPATFTLLRRKLSRPWLTGAVAIWAVALVLTILGQWYGALLLYATVISAAILSVLKDDWRRHAAAELSTCALAIFVMIETSSLYYWIGASLNPHGQAGLLAQELELNLTFFLFPIEILVMLLLLLSWVPLTYQSWRPRKGALLVHYEATRKWSLRLLAVALDLFAIVAMLVFFYPYLAGQTWIVGVDSYWRYLNPLTAFAGLAPSQVFATSVTHGFYVALLYLIELATGSSAFSVVKFAPLVLAFATASAVFLALIRGGWKFELAFLSAICTLLWFPTTLGIYAGLQSNWLAYLLWMLFLSLYLQTKNWNAITFLLQGIISLAILVVHPWTWGVFIVSLLLTVLVSWRTAWKTRSVQGALASLIITLPVSAGAYQIFPSLRSDWMSAIGLYTLPLIQPSSLLTFGDAMTELFLNWTPFLPPILLVICLVGVYCLSKQEGVVRNYLVGWIIAWCIGSILVAPTGFNPTNVGLSETGLWRMLYVSPLPILLALGIHKGLGIFNRLQESDSFRPWSRNAFLVSVVLIVASAVLFISEEPAARLITVGAVVALFAVLMMRFPTHPTARFLIATVLVMLLVNAALRSLYPLLLDPHSLFGPVGAQ